LNIEEGKLRTSPLEEWNPSTVRSSVTPLVPREAGAVLIDELMESMSSPNRNDDTNPEPLHEDRIPTEIVPRQDRKDRSLRQIRSTIGPADAADVEDLKKAQGIRGGSVLREDVARHQPPVHNASFSTSVPRPRYPTSAIPGTHSSVNAPIEDREQVEVHVHIGRIEITAVQESGLVKPAPKSKRKPLSLDEYLDKSHRRSP